MLTNEEIIERYGNHPENNRYDGESPADCILCENCPVQCDTANRKRCNRFETAYERIRGFLRKTQTPDPAADTPQKDKADADILYICDRRACEVCDPNCRATKDIRHAKHFELMGRTMVEVEPKPPTYL